MARRPARVFLLEALLVVLLSPALQLLAVRGQLATGWARGVALAAGYGGLLRFFGPAILVAAVGSGLITSLFTRRRNPTLYSVATITPFLLLPAVVFAWLVVLARTTIPVVQDGQPFLLWSSLAGVAAGLIFTLVDITAPGITGRSRRGGAGSAP